MTIANATKVATQDQNDDVDNNVDPAARPTRRILSVEEKLDLLARYEACASGQKGAFARREGVYSSRLTEWRRAREAGTLGAKTARRTRAEDREIDKLTKKNQRLEDELERTRLALDIVGKVSALQNVLIDLVGIKRSCALLGRVRSTFYRRQQPVTPMEPVTRASPPNALSAPERTAVFTLLNEPEHCDFAVD
jgi:transposase-like protein